MKYTIEITQAHDLFRIRIYEGTEFVMSGLDTLENTLKEAQYWMSK